MSVAPGTPNHVIPFWSEIDFRKLSWTCVSRLSRKWMKGLRSTTAGFIVFSAQFTANSVSAEVLYWKKTSRSLSPEAFSTALRRRLFPLNIMASPGWSPQGRKQIFKVQKGLLSPCSGCAAHTLISISLFPFFQSVHMLYLYPVCKREWWLIHVESLTR